MWTGYEEGMSIIVCGVKDSEITEDGLGFQEFANLTEARKVFPDLDPEKPTKRFTPIMNGGTKDGKNWGRFETWKAEAVYSR